MSRITEYDRFDGLGLAELVRSGDVTPAELVEEAIRRIELLNPSLNAVIHRMDARARADAAGTLPDGPFRGVPFLIKDLVALVAGEPMRAGSRFLADYLADHDSELFSRYRRAGFVTVGKTNTPEFGLTPFTEPVLFGPTNNPWNLSRIAGGSSGGSAAAVAAGIVPIAGGGDGGGSIRIPASCCGIFGLKPTRGRTPTGPDRGEIWQGCVVEHVLTRTVRDSAAVLDATCGPDVGAPYAAPKPDRPFLEEVTAEPRALRIAVMTEPLLGGDVHQDCIAAVHQTAELLRLLGHTVDEASPTLDGKAFARNFMVMIAGELRGDIEEVGRLIGKRPHAGAFEPTTWALGLLGRSLSAAEFVGATRALQLASRGVAHFFEDWDLLLTPTLATPPPPTGSLQPTAREAFLLGVLGRLNAGGLLKAAGALEEAASKAFAFTPWTPVFNVTGQPAMSVPLEWNAEELPIGVHFVGRYGDEATLLRLAGQLERAKPWFDRRPPTVADPQKR
jgi:amidase